MGEFVTDVGKEMELKSKTLIIGCAHGKDGINEGNNQLHNPGSPWLTSENKAEYAKYLRHNVVCESEDVGAMVKWGYLFKSCIDAGIELLNTGKIIDFRAYFALGGFFKKTEKWLNTAINECIEEELDDPFVIAIGKSFGGFDIIRAVSGIGNKEKYKPIDTDLMILLDPDESLDWNNKKENIIPKNVKRVINFVQNQNTGPARDYPKSLRGHLIGPKAGNKVSKIENISFKKNTRFPDNAEVFPGELLNHWTIDEYLPVVGYRGMKLSNLITKAVLRDLPENLLE